MKYLFLLLISFNTLAHSELTLSYARINQKLFDKISFPMEAVKIDYDYVSKYDFGVNLSLARSTETANELNHNIEYKNKITALYSASVFYRYELTNNLSFDAGVGITDYKSTWKVNGVIPEWGYGTDSDTSYFLKANYQLNQDWSLSAAYYNFYRKNKKGYGREETTAFSIGLKYVF